MILRGTNRGVGTLSRTGPIKRQDAEKGEEKDERTRRKCATSVSVREHVCDNQE